MPRFVPTEEMNNRCRELINALIKRAMSNSALARALDYSPTQIGHLLNARRPLSNEGMHKISDYLAIPQEMVESYYLAGTPSLPELLSVPKLTGRVDLQTAIECLNEAPSLVKIEQGLQLLHKGLAERELGVSVPPMPFAASYKAFTDYFREAVEANSRIKLSSQASKIGVPLPRFQQMLDGEVAPTLDEIARIAANYPDSEGELDNPEFWGGLAFPHLQQKNDRAAHPEMAAL